jgi:Rps23 Pro-64 3,4-dihydroxylase Tpa1-like proline 4-hydroxylase
MYLNSMLSNKWRDDQLTIEWKKKFNSALPFRFLVIDNAIDLDLAENLSREFPSLEHMKVNYKGINEAKSEHSSFEDLHPDFLKIKEIFNSHEVTTLLESISGISTLQNIDDRYGYGLHQGGRHSFLDIHVDYNLHPTKKKQRRLNLILFLNKDWEPGWGGELEFWDKNVTRCLQSIQPIFNRCVIFECNEYSYHGYSKINCPEGVTRRSFYTYFFSEPAENLVFHDTIFRNKPNDSVLKKIIIPIKEFSKTVIKRLLYRIGALR